MGTRGYYVFCFRGRFYVYYNHYDSYPSGLGQWILDGIPNDPAEYQAWLESLRAWYLQYEQLLSGGILTFDDEDEKGPWRLKVEQKLKCPPPPECPKVPPRSVEPDTTLELLPSPMALLDVDPQIEWIYVIDLDKAELRVNAGLHTWSYKLNQKPTEDQFCSLGDKGTGEKDDSNNEGLNQETKDNDPTKDGDETNAGEGAKKDNLPQDQEQPNDCQETEGDEKSEGVEISKDKEQTEDEAMASDELGDLSVSLSKVHFPDVDEVEYHFRYVHPKRTIDQHYSMQTHRLIQRFLFRQLAETHKELLVDHVLKCQPEDFIYREFAFTIISLAAGEFSLLERRSFSNWDPDGLSVCHADGSKTFLPAFGRGIHKRHVEPGSAPKETMYWFENVLVSLVDPESFESPEIHKAEVVKALQFALDTGRRCYHGLIFSLSDVVLIRVLSTGAVEYTAPLALLDSYLFSHPDRDDSYDAFVAMTHLFDAALGHSKPNAGRLSDEVYHKIMDHTDWITYHACAKVSPTFGRYAKSRLRLGDRIITRLRPSSFKAGHRQSARGFLVGDISKQTDMGWAIIPKVQDNFYPSIFREILPEDATQWHLAVGKDDRMSILAPVAFQLRKVGLSGQKDENKVPPPAD